MCVTGRCSTCSLQDLGSQVHAASISVQVFSSYCSQSSFLSISFSLRLSPNFLSASQHAPGSAQALCYKCYETAAFSFTGHSLSKYKLNLKMNLYATSISKCLLHELEKDTGNKKNKRRR